MFTIDGKKDAYGINQPEMSLKYLLGNCKDFEEEASLLQAVGRKMGVAINCTPKCHFELAGEGIEYSWGLEKFRKSARVYLCLPGFTAGG